MHEKFGHGDEIKGGSDRSFGIVFAVVFAIIGLWPVMNGGAPRWWGLAIAAVFLMLALAAPTTLAPLNRLWFKFGLLLAKVVNPVVMGILFFLMFVPAGLVMRLLGKDPLRRRFDPEQKSYWIERHPPGPPPDTMKNQF